MRFRLIDAGKAELPIERMCGLLELWRKLGDDGLTKAAYRGG